MAHEKGGDFVGQLLGDEKQIEVIMWDGSRDKYGKKLYTLKCHKCAQDAELFGDALWKRTKSDAQRFISCGCAKSVKWNYEQYVVILKRYCKSKNYEFIGFKDCEVISRGSKVVVKCLVDDTIWDTTSICDLLGGHGCPKCAKEISILANTKPDSELINSFYSTGSFDNVENFWRSPAKDKWFSNCKICSNDIFVKNKVCSGIFESDIAALQVGGKPCRCAHCYTHTPEQKRFLIEEIIREENLDISFIGWDGDYVGTKGKMNLNCNLHGPWTVSIAGFLNSNNRCPSCAKTGFDPNKKGYLYILKVEGISSSFTGFGISNIVKDRIKCHKRNLGNEGLSITEIIVFESHGWVVQNIEKEITSNFETNSQNIVGFKREATYLEHFKEVVSFVEQQITSFDNSQN